MGRSSTVELRFLVPAVGGSNPSVPALKNTALQALMNLERFLVGKRRDSNPQGCEAEETRSVFQRSTQGAKRRSGARPPKRRTRNPSVPQPALGDVPKVPALKERLQVPASQKSTFKRQAPQAHKDQERLSSRKYQPSSEKRAACNNQVTTGPGRAGTPA